MRAVGEAASVAEAHAAFMVPSELDEAGRPAEPLLRVREHLRAAVGESDRDLVRVVLAHVRGAGGARGVRAAQAEGAGPSSTE